MMIDVRFDTVLITVVDGAGYKVDGNLNSGAIDIPKTFVFEDLIGLQKWLKDNLQQA